MRARFVTAVHHHAARAGCAPSVLANDEGERLTLGRGISLIDFDRTRYAPPAYEVMRALIYCVKPSGPRSAFEGRAAAFLGGYLAARPLSGREIETMAALYGTVHVLGVYGLGACHGASAAALGFGEARFSLLYWLRRNGSAVAGLARQAAGATAG